MSSSRVSCTLLQVSNVVTKHLLEPIGSSTPKFSSVTAHEQSFRAGSECNIVCPAQASPTPAFRLESPPHLLILAPIGTSAPRFSIESKTSSLVRSSEKGLSLSCSAQSSPVPSFRFVWLWLEPVGTCEGWEKSITCNWGDLTVVPIALLHSFGTPRWVCLMFGLGQKSSTEARAASLPVSVTGPAGTPSAQCQLGIFLCTFHTLNTARAPHIHHLSSFCSSVDILEPIGGSVPKASSNIDPATTISVSSHHSLTCPVQASPRPSFRWCGSHSPPLSSPHWGRRHHHATISRRSLHWDNFSELGTNTRLSLCDRITHFIPVSSPRLLAVTSLVSGSSPG